MVNEGRPEEILVALFYLCKGAVQGMIKIALALLLMAAPAMAQTSAKFVGQDTATQGHWIGKYGKDGVLLAGDTKSAPSYLSYNAATGNISGSYYQWSSSTTDVRAAQSSTGAATTQASCWYNTNGTPGFTFSANLTDGKVHRLSFYLLDWDRQGRSETITLTNAANGVKLDTEVASNFQNGTYFIWDISGNVNVQFTPTVSNGVLSDIFFDITPAIPPQPPTLSVISATVTLNSAAPPVTHSVALSWAASSIPVGAAPISGYNVYRGTASSGPFTKIGSYGTAVPLTYTDLTVQPGLTYFYVVTGVNSSGESAFSNEASAQIP
jgi:hypothetical protein